MFKYLKHHQTVFHRAHIFNSHQHCMNVLISPHPHQCFYFSFLSYILLAIKRYHLVGLIYTFVWTAMYLFMGLLAIYVSPLYICLWMIHVDVLVVCPGSHHQSSVCPFFPYRPFLLQAMVLQIFGHPQLHQWHRLFRVLGTGQSIELCCPCHKGPRPYNTGVTRRPAPQRADSQDKCPRFPCLALSPANTVRKLRPRRPPSGGWTSWQQLQGSWALGPHWSDTKPRI